MAKRALILGVGGMDGSHLAEILLEKGYEVHGLYRRSSVDNLERIRHLDGLLTLHKGDLLDRTSLRETLKKASPDEVYNMADQDHVGWSVATPEYSRQVTWGGAVNAIEAAKAFGKVRFFQPLSATIFGCHAAPQNERTPHDPRSPYAAAKRMLRSACEAHRQRGMDLRCAIFFNHESPRRGPGYLLQTICRQIVEYGSELRDSIALGGQPETPVDIGWAPDYMRAAHQIMQLPSADEFCIGTGKGTTIQEWVEIVLATSGAAGVRRRAQQWAAEKLAAPEPPPLIVHDVNYPTRPAQETLVADCRKANEAFGWEPHTPPARMAQELLVKWSQRIA